MSTEQCGVLAIFSYLDDFCEAIKKISSRSEFADHEVFSPTSYHEVEHACKNPTSPVRFFTLLGALTGVCAGFALTLSTDYDWPLVVGGKTAGIPSLPAYVVIGFECMILLGAIFTIMGMLVMGRIPNPKTTILDNRLTDSKFAIFVPNITPDSAPAKFLKECGAEEVKLVGASS